MNKTQKSQHIKEQKDINGVKQKHPKAEKYTNETILQQGIVVAIAAIFCCALWGSAFPCIKIGYQLFAVDAADYRSQILFAGIRFALAGLMVILFTSLIQRKPLVPKRTSWKMIIKLCMAQTVLQYLCFYIGLANTTGVKASIIEGANVFIAILVACMIFKMEKFTVSKAVGSIAGFIGIVVVNIGNAPIGGGFRFMGEGMILLSTVAYAVSSVLIKDFSKKENPVILSGYQFLCGGIIMILFGGITGGRIETVSTSGVLMLIYLAFISAMAYTVWSILLKHNKVSKVAVYGFANPMFGVILSAIFLKGENQAFSLYTGIALILVCFGIYVVNRENV